MAARKRRCKVPTALNGRGQSWRRRCSDGLSPRSEVFELTAIDPWFLNRRSKAAGRRGSTGIGEERASCLTISDERVAAPAISGFFRSLSWRCCCARSRGRGARAAKKGESIRARRTSASTPAPAEFEALHALPVFDVRRTKTRRPPTDRGRRCSFWAAGRFASGRASSSITAACTPRLRCASAGFETLMLNCNPETVSTDFDTSDRLYFEPLTHRRRARGRRDREKPIGCDRAAGWADAAQDLGQSARKRPACRFWAPRLTAIDRAEDRERFSDAGRES